ncbi:MAG: hypothetical protein F4X11_08630, partial [Acidobacteria bacterium]|nr:hypothetical protein [Acidobacteriota bacterium]
GGGGPPPPAGRPPAPAPRGGSRPTPAPPAPRGGRAPPPPAPDVEPETGTTREPGGEPAGDDTSES